MWTLLSSLFMTAFLAECHPVGQPRVQLGDTALIGSHLQASNVEFFGGSCFFSSFWRHVFLNSHVPGIPFAEPPVGDLRFSPPQPKYSLSPLQSFDARNYGDSCLQPVRWSSALLHLGIHSSFHSYHLRICQRTVSHLMFSNLPALILVRLCL